MRSDVFLVNQINPAGAVDQRKLVRSVLQRIANLTGERIYSSELSSDKNFVEPQECSAEPFGEARRKHQGSIFDRSL